MNQTYQFQCSVVAPVAREFAWRFWSDVKNWTLDSDIESVELNGPFAAGTHGVTQSKSSGRIEWVLGDVQPEKSAITEIPFLGGVARFEMRFEDAEGQTKITQRVAIEGEKAQEFGQMLEPGIAQGMRKLSEKMAETATKSGQVGTGGRS